MCGFIEIRLPEGLRNIGVGAFMGCNSLTEIDLPKSLEKIDMWGFASCDNLQEITFQGTSAEIGQQAFVNCYTLKTVTFSGGTGNGGLSFDFDEEIFGTVLLGEYMSALQQQITFYIPDGLTFEGLETLRRFGRFVYYE